MHWRYGEACRGSRGREWRDAGGGWGSGSAALSSTCAVPLGLRTPAARLCREVQQFTMATIRNSRDTCDSHYTRWQHELLHLPEISHPSRKVSVLHECDLIVRVWHVCVQCFQHRYPNPIYGRCMHVSLQCVCLSDPSHSQAMIK